MLNNRELASVTWLGVILVAASLSGSVRSSLWQLVKVALHWKLLLVWGGFAAVLTATVYWLRRADLTYADSTKGCCRLGRHRRPTAIVQGAQQTRCTGAASGDRCGRCRADRAR